ncbi:MAG: hypothetical protein PWQ25_81 [Deferribacteres bacterium]|jgi:uncharacterized membrane protein (DUF4010 family)|nr:hypothetical protein [Deferribacteres bacterium]
MNEAYLFFISVAISFLIGLERQFSIKSENNRETIAGVRTFSLVGIFAYISGFLSIKFSYYFGVAGFIGAIVFAVLGYIRDFKTDERGLTTEVAFVVTFLSSYLIALGEVKLGIAAGVVLFAFLSNKSLIHKFVFNMKKEDFVAILKFLVLASIIYPVVPDKSYFGIELLNPSDIFKIVIVIAGISFLGYAGVRVVGVKKGILISSVIGAFVSSTAVTINLSNLYRQDKRLRNILILCILLGCTIMFIRIMVLVWIFNFGLFKDIFIYISPGIILLVILSTIFFKNGYDIKGENVKIDNPVNIFSALKFAFLLGVIIILADFMGKKFGNKGIVLLSVFSGISDVDAITVMLSKMATENIQNEVYILGIVVAAVVNNLVKGGLSIYIGGFSFGIRVFIPLALSSIFIFVVYFLKIFYFQP